MSIKDGILDLTIKSHWFNLIKNGQKTHEYRNGCTWRNKLEYNSEKYHTVRFRNGMLVKSTDKNNVILAKIKSITLKDGRNTDLKIDEPVYDIEFEL